MQPQKPATPKEGSRRPEHATALGPAATHQAKKKPRSKELGLPLIPYRSRIYVLDSRSTESQQFLTRGDKNPNHVSKVTERGIS